MSEKLRDLYKSIILEESKKPFHYQEMEEADQVLEAYNQFCGDHFYIYLKIEEGKISAASFQGYGCAISKASTSILIKKILGQPFEKVQSIVREYLTTVNSESPPSEQNPEFKAFQAAKNFPTRIKCATLSWQEVQKFINLD